MEEVQEVVRARRFELVGKDGETRAIIGTTEDDCPEILLSSPNDAVHVALRIDKEIVTVLPNQPYSAGLHLTVYDARGAEDGEAVSWLAISADGEGQGLFLAGEDLGKVFISTNPGNAEVTVSEKTAGSMTLRAHSEDGRGILSETSDEAHQRRHKMLEQKMAEKAEVAEPLPVKEPQAA